MNSQERNDLFYMASLGKIMGERSYTTLALHQDFVNNTGSKESLSKSLETESIYWYAIYDLSKDSKIYKKMLSIGEKVTFDIGFEILFQSPNFKERKIILMHQYMEKNNIEEFEVVTNSPDLIQDFIYDYCFNDCMEYMEEEVLQIGLKKIKDEMWEDMIMNNYIHNLDDNIYKEYIENIELVGQEGPEFVSYLFKGYKGKDFLIEYNKLYNGKETEYTEYLQVCCMDKALKTMNKRDYQILFNINKSFSTRIISIVENVTK